MRTLLFVLSFLAISYTSLAQKCDAPVKESYKKVLSSAFSKDYEKCPVIIEAEYFKEGYLKGARKPRKLKKKYFFQCVAVGEDGTQQPFQSGLSGDFFVISKKMADAVLDLKKGDKLELTGTTFTQNYFGTKLYTFFVVSDVKKL